MLSHIAQFTAWPILTGILIGYVANKIMSGEGKGCCMNLVIGVISTVLHVDLGAGGYLLNFAFCIAGSVAALWLWCKLMA